MSGLACAVQLDFAEHAGPLQLQANAHAAHLFAVFGAFWPVWAPPRQPIGRITPCNLRRMTQRE
ncbi:MAG: hypothetical protein ACOVO0_17170 [Burkholderiaceae bacterium]